jgi:hypothetical protein
MVGCRAVLLTLWVCATRAGKNVDDTIGQDKIQVGLMHQAGNLKNVERMMSPTLRKSLRQAISKEETPEIKQVTAAIAEFEHIKDARQIASLLSKSEGNLGATESIDEVAIRKSITDEIGSIADYQEAIERYERKHKGDAAENGNLLTFLYIGAFISGIFGATFVQGRGQPAQVYVTVEEGNPLKNDEPTSPLGTPSKLSRNKVMFGASPEMSAQDWGQDGLDNGQECV